MSWVRWGSKCDFLESPCSAAPAECPGSDVYVYEGSAEDGRDGFVCCCGGSDEVNDDGSFNFVCATEAEMMAHLKEHVAKGDHVPMSLLE